MAFSRLMSLLLFTTLSRTNCYRSVRRLNFINISPLFSFDHNDASPPKYFRGQQIKIDVVQFGRLGAKVVINDDEKTTGLVLQSEIAHFRSTHPGEDVKIGDNLVAYIDRVRDDGLIDVNLKPVGQNRMLEVRQMVLEAIEGSPQGSIPVGDKSSPEDIKSYFYGVSKSEFKMAVGLLYNDGIVKPGKLETVLIPEDKRDPEKVATGISRERMMKDKLSRYENTIQDVTLEVGFGLKTQAVLSGNTPKSNSASSIFIGNLPFSINEKIMQNTLTKLLGAEVIVAIRLAMDSTNNKPRGFGYIDLTDESKVGPTLEALKGFKIMGRIIRVDRADRLRSEGKGEQDILGEEISATSNVVAKAIPKMKPPRLPSDRDISKTIFIGNLPFSSDADSIKRALANKLGDGIVVDMKIPTDPVTGKAKGYGYCDLSSEEFVISAITALSGFVLDGREV